MKKWNSDNSRASAYFTLGGIRPELWVKTLIQEIVLFAILKGFEF